MTERGKVLEAKPVPEPSAINIDGFKIVQNVTATLAYLAPTIKLTSDI
jgi:hypothetical protein